MRFGNFLFPAAMDPADDQRVIQETLDEAQLCDELGMDMLWLAEHHFDGICAYVDPVTFAAALAASTKQIHIGFAVAQMSLHHPIRLAEQMALIDNISRGRVVVGLGRGTAFNIYEYQGYGIESEGGVRPPDRGRADHDRGVDDPELRARGEVLEPEACHCCALARTRSPIRSSSARAPARSRRSTWRAPDARS